MITQETIDRIRDLDAGEYPVLSVYLGLRPGEHRAAAARLKELLSPVKDELNGWSRSAMLSLRDDVDRVVAQADRLAAEAVPGVAVFLSSGAGIEEILPLPAPVRDRAIVDVSAYVRPLETIADYFPTYCAVVMERRKASIFRYRMGELASWEEMREEEIRKQNYGGFSGYEEHGVRERAEQIAQRHYRDTSARLVDLHRSDGFDLLLMGGPQEHVEGLRDELPSEISGLVAGTFTIDPNTMTPALVRGRCDELSALYQEAQEQRLVADVMDAHASGRPATLGIDETIPAVNQRAVDTLVLQSGATTPGYICTGCQWVTRKPEALCPACGETMRPVPDLLDAISINVQNAGGSVRNVLAETPLERYEVAASLRYALPT